MTFLATAFLSVGLFLQAQIPFCVAHRGAWIKDEVPENSVAGIESAARYGIKAIELDVKYSKDSVMIVLHDPTMNRTYRTVPDMEPLATKVKASETGFWTLRRKFLTASDVPAMRLPMPTLENMLLDCRRFGVIPMLHSDIPASYRLAQDILGDNWVCFSTEYDAVKQSREFSNCLILWDPGNTPLDETLERLAALGGHVGVSSMNRNLLTAEYCKIMRDHGYEVQASIFPSPYDAAAIANGVTIVLSDFCWMPDDSVKPYKKHSIKKLNLAEGETFTYSPGKEIPYSSLTIDFVATGKVEVTAAGRTYVVEAGQPFLDGWRLRKAVPEVTVKALEPATLTSGHVRIYTYPDEPVAFLKK